MIPTILMTGSLHEAVGSVLPHAIFPLLFALAMALISIIDKEDENDNHENKSCADNSKEKNILDTFLETPLDELVGGIVLTAVLVIGGAAGIAGIIYYISLKI